MENAYGLKGKGTWRAQNQNQEATFHYMTILHLLNTDSYTCTVYSKNNNHMKFFFLKQVLYPQETYNLMAYPGFK